MANHNCSEIEAITPASAAEAAGLLPGDIILTANGRKIGDSIDFLFYGNEDTLSLVVRRKGRRLTFDLDLGSSDSRDPGIELKPFKIKVCRNNCLFCFVAQLPKGLRKTLYVRDEDYRMSFLYGNYITLTNLTEKDKERIVEQRLSPLYLSVHATNPLVRNTLLGNPKAPDVLKEIQFFKDHKIRMHCQIVLCPGYNNGSELERTIRDLYRFYPYVASLAVVPVGLTAYRRSHAKLRSLEKEDATEALKIIDSFQRRFRKKHGEGIVYGADELYIKAEAPLPPLADYGELPQIENGVGLVPLFLAQARKLKIPAPKAGQRLITFTGLSFAPFLLRLIERLKKAGHDIDLVPVENTFFGKSVTVTGLLTGRDVIRSLAETVKPGDLLLIPDVVMREGEEVFLDDVTRQDVEEILGVSARMVEASPKGLFDALSSNLPATVQTS